VKRKIQISSGNMLVKKRTYLFSQAQYRKEIIVSMKIARKKSRKNSSEAQLYLNF
jgi:hypothetical protein